MQSFIWLRACPVDKLRVPNSPRHLLRPPLNEKVLHETALAMVAKGRGILAADESGPTIAKRFLAARAKAIESGEGIDWAYAESLAFGSILTEGHGVRLSGQDVRRGTFSHRHSVFYDTETRERHIPLNNLAEEQGNFCVYNSLLSEVAVLGFDYGYSLLAQNMLICWEAQFGDFVNGAQVILDQFIASAESKWQRPSHVTLLLPHGFEGQGPEHSSARLERFLQNSAGGNWQVCNFTTPAQYYHALRRQVKRSTRKPLIVMTPKSLLRHKRAVSAFEDMGPGSTFHRILWDDAQKGNSTLKLKSDDKIKRVVRPAA